MNIYLDESYNLQKTKGKLLISINGFVVLNDRKLRKRWEQLRKSYRQVKRRIRATDSYFEELRIDSIKLLSRSDILIISIFQSVPDLPHRYFGKDGVQFDLVYTDLLKKLFIVVLVPAYKKPRIVLDARKLKGGKLGEKAFRKEMDSFFKEQFFHTPIIFKLTPSYMDTLVELADFVSNTLYKEYQAQSNHVFTRSGFKFLQIKNPL